MEEKAVRSRQDRSTIRLKKSTVDAAPLPPTGKRTVLWDSEVKGFGVRISANGSKTYILRYRTGGRATPPRTYTIGQHGSPFTTEQARTRASELLMQIRSGGDPAAERQAERVREKADATEREERLFGTMAETWFRKHVERKGLRSAKDIRGVLDRDLKPAFADKTVDEITKKDVTKALDAIGERSGAAANKAHKWIRKMLNWLVDQGELAHSVMQNLSRPFPEQARERVLPLGELVVLWIALDAIQEPFRSFYRLLILLGQRLRETANVPWGEIDFEGEEWLLPRARTKSDRDHLVPLSKQAIELLEAVQPDADLRTGLAFTTNGKTGISGFSKMKTAIDEELVALLARNANARLLVPNGFAPWVIHDLRRSLGTGCQGLGIPIEHSDAVLNHAVGSKVSGVTRVYHLYDYYDEKAEALEKWGELILAAVKLAREGNIEGVIELDPARRSRRRRRQKRREGNENN